MEKNLDKQNLIIENKFLQSLGPSLNRGSTVLLKLVNNSLRKYKGN